MAATWQKLLSLPSEKYPREKAFKAAKESQSLFQRLNLLHTLDNHRGCVNTIVWNETGNYILSGSDDHRLIIAEPYTKRVLADEMTSHRSNIFSAKFLPGTSDRNIISCAGDGTLLFTDIERCQTTNSCSFTCHSGTAYEVLTIPDDSNSFLSCGEDGSVRWFDLRTKQSCHKTECKEDILISMDNAITTMSLNPLLPFYLAVGSSDSAVRIFDRRQLGSKPRNCYTALVSRFLLPEMSGKRRRITSIDYRPDGQEILVSFSSDFIYTFYPEDNSAQRETRLYVGRPPVGLNKSGRVRQRSPPPMKRLRLRGDWSDTGPNARPEAGSRTLGDRQESPGRESATLLMQRMTEALSRMLNDPATRNAVRVSAARDMIAQQQQQQEQPSDSSDSNRVEGHNSNNDDEDVEVGDTSEAAVTSRPGSSAIGGSIDGVGSVGRLASAHSFDGLQESVTHMREDFVQRHNTEPNVSLTYRRHGVENSVISLAPPSNDASNVDELPATSSAATTNETSVNSSPRAEGSMPSISSTSSPPVPTTLPIISEPTGAASSVIATASLSETRSTAGSPDSNSTSSTLSPTSAFAHALPGPSQVVTHPGNSSTNSAGERQRRRGVSGPPTGTIEFPSGISGFAGGAISPSDIDSSYNQEFEIGADDDNDEEDDHHEDDRRWIPQPDRVKKFVGHRNARTMIKEASWWGNDFIVSGSDCGHIFGWHRQTEKLVLLLEADRHVVNCVQPHPFDPVLISSGIDYNIKVWTPSKMEAEFNEETAQTLCQKNRIMLEETMDTITVPATLMIRMLATLNRFRRARRADGRQDEDVGGVIREDVDNED